VKKRRQNHTCLRKSCVNRNGPKKVGIITSSSNKDKQKSKKRFLLKKKKNLVYKKGAKHYKNEAAICSLNCHCEYQNTSITKKAGNGVENTVK